MWLYTSYAVQPHRSVASKNGDLRYHGPKYKVLEVTSGIALTSPVTAPPSFHRGAWPWGAREPRHGSSLHSTSTESLFNSIRGARGTREPRVFGTGAAGLSAERPEPHQQP